MIERFESRCEALVESHCSCCRRVGLRLRIGRRGVCSECSKYRDPNHFANAGWLPIWFEDNVPQYHVPECLASLSLAEKMLIQLASPFVPLRHIKNGVFGLAGHVCCFDQNIEGFVDTLPRQKSDVTMLEVMRTIATEIGGDADRLETYKVRRSNVGTALKWLKRYNSEYQSIRIDMTALDWLEGEQGVLEVIGINAVPGVNANQNDRLGVDLGPCAALTRSVMASGDNVHVFGYMNEANAKVLSPSDVIIHNEVVETIDGSDQKEHIRVEWPAVGPVAINEYGDTRIFARAFPWLFPGGGGDVKAFAGDIKKWGENMLNYEDGRFTRDRFFCFFALNYITRNRNASSGNWFVKDFNRGGPSNLEELKASIEAGDLRFVNRLTYYNKRVKGSSPFWFQKRSEVYTWINHHVEVGNGPPTFFITLSCSEYYWDDILRLIRARMKRGGDKDEECYKGSPRLSRILNDYAIVIQEYFQARVEEWIETCGKAIFGIAHWWGRYEFAPGRGQIHIHLLATRADQTILRLCFQDLKQPNGKVLRDNRLAEWAAAHFGLTAMVSDSFDDINITPEESPCSIRFSSIAKEPEAIAYDAQRLLSFCQVHECNAFCLRKKGSKRYALVLRCNTRHCVF